MIDVQDALKIVLDTARDFGAEIVPLGKGIGRVLREDWYCDRDLPPYDRVTMDGIAINYDGAKRSEQLLVEGIVAAGDPQTELVDPGKCLEIMTGASMPVGGDTVIRYEDITIKNGIVKIDKSFQKGQNIHWKGEDRKKGDLLVSSNTLLSSSEIGIGASIGKSEITVANYPKTIIVSTGNELVEVHESPLPHQIRRGNVYRMMATLNHLGIETVTDHILDDEDETVAKVSDYLDNYDLVIFSGGVSKGKYDFLPSALKTCGVKQLFHRVAQRPGKPLWFGTHRGGTTIFGLPGNPVSSFMCLHIYVLDWVRKCLGLGPETRPNAVLTDNIIFKPDLTYFHEVSLRYDINGQILAKPEKGNGSGDLANLINGDAFIRIPRGKEVFEKGEVYPIYIYRQ